jgi:hypothetical protein
MRRLRIVLVAVLPLVASTQTTNRPEEQIESEVARHIEALEKRFGELLKPTESEQSLAQACRHNCQAAAPGVREAAKRAGVERDKAMDAVASQIHSEIDGYITHAIRPDHFDPGAVQQALKRILGKATWGPTSVFVININRTPSLVVTYTLAKGTMMGPGATSVTTRVYAVDQGNFRFVAATGTDMDGYADVSIVQLHSPVPDEMWFLLRGQMTGANGPNIRLQVWSYGKTKFRSRWVDDDWGAFTVRVTDRGFTVQGPYYTAASGIDRGVRHDTYYLAKDGVHRVLP